MKKINIFILVIILLIGAWFRLYKLAEVPVSLSWDEVSNGYDSWAVSNYGIDQWGHFLPLTFKSFEDDKHPVHTYVTAISTRILGLSDYSTRLPAALIGIANIALLYFLTLHLFKNRLMATLTAVSLAISPYAIQFSRWDHEAGYALFLFFLGSWLFFRGLEKKSRLIIWAFLILGLDLLTYHSAKIIIPPVLIYLCLVFRHSLGQVKKYFISGLVILIVIILIILTHPALLGTARITQASIDDNTLKKFSTWYQQTGSVALGRVQIIGQQYISHFTPEYLFISGDKNGRHSSQTIGQFYWLDLPFLILGLLGLLWQRSKISGFILLWALLAPLPASLVQEAPHAARSIYMLGSWQIVISYGLYLLITLLKFKTVQIATLVAIIFGYGILFYPFWDDYLHDYGKRQAIEWQYGMKEVVEYVSSNPQYSQVFMTAERHQPYIFFLYYMKTSPKEFQKTVGYNHDISRSYNLVSSYGKFYFGDWDIAASFPNVGVLYIFTPTEYSSLSHKNEFMVKKKVIYPDGSDAFFLVSYN